MKVFHLKCEKGIDPKDVEEGLKMLGYEPTVYPGELGGLDVLLPDKQIGNYEMLPLIAKEIVGVIGVGPEPALSTNARNNVEMLIRGSSAFNLYR